VTGHRLGRLHAVAKLRNSTDELHTEIRRLTDEVRRLRKELETTTRERQLRPLADDCVRTPASYRRQRASFT